MNKSRLQLGSALASSPPWAALLLLVLGLSLRPCLASEAKAKAPRAVIGAREILKALGLSVKNAADECEFQRVPADEAQGAVEAGRKAETRDEEAKPMLLVGVANWTSKKVYKSKAKLIAEHGNLAVKVGDAGAIQAYGGRPSVTQKWPLSKVLDAPHPRGYVAFSDLRRKGKNTPADKLLAGVEVYPQLSDFGDQFVLSIGHDGTGLSPHVHGDTYLSLMQGKKLWLLQPPAQAHWAPRHAAFAKELQEKGRPPDTLLCLQRPGETVFVPAGWGHATVNVGLSVGIGQQEPPGPLIHSIYAENDKNIHTLLRASLGAADIGAAVKHVKVVLEEDPDNVEALVMLAQADVELPDVSAAGKRKSCRAVAGRLKKWLSKNDPDDELAGAGLEFLTEFCEGHMEDGHGEL